MRLGRNGHHLVPQSRIQHQILLQPNVILDVSAELCFAHTDVGRQDRAIARKRVRLIG